jgi:hypothetical protein
VNNCNNKADLVAWLLYGDNQPKTPEILIQTEPINSITITSVQTTQKSPQTDEEPEVEIGATVTTTETETQTVTETNTSVDGDDDDEDDDDEDDKPDDFGASITTTETTTETKEIDDMLASITTFSQQTETVNTKFNNLKWKWNFNLGYGTRKPVEIRTGNAQQRFLNSIRFLIRLGRRLYIQVTEDGSILVTENYDRSPNGPHIIVTGTQDEPEGDQLIRIQVLFQLLQANLGKIRVVSINEAHNQVQPADFWLVTITQLLTQSKSVIITIKSTGQIEVAEDPNSQFGGSITYQYNKQDKYQRGIYNAIFKTIKRNKDLVQFTFDQTQFSENSGWFKQLLFFLQKKFQVDITVNKNGKISVRKSVKQTGSAGWKIVTVVNQKQVVQSSVVTRLTAWLSSLTILEQYTTVQAPATPLTAQFNDQADWWVTLVQLLKENFRAEITVTNDGKIEVRKSKKQNGPPGYVITNNIKKIRDRDSPLFKAIFSLQAFLEERKAELEEYITITTTTTTVSQNQVSGVEAFLNSLALLIEQGKQFTITIGDDLKYHVEEIDPQNADGAYFIVQYSTTTPTEDQTASWDRLYEALNTREDIIQFDRTPKVAVDPFNAEINTIETKTTTSTVPN